MVAFKNMVSKVVISALVFTGGGFVPPALAENEAEERVITSMTVDQAMYDPGSMVSIDITLKNTTNQAIESGMLAIQAKHLQNEVGSNIQESFSLDIDEQKTVTIEWEAPDEDFHGYLLEAKVKEGDELIDENSKAVDVSSSWTKFPRYGYVWDFTDGVDTKERVDALKNRNINALEYYDWKYLHHKPVPDDRNLENWDDWTGRSIYAESIRRYIQDAKEANMVNMPYNMAYAAVDGYEEDGVNQDWALYFSDENDRGEGHFSFDMSDTNALYFFDMANKDWQDYIFSRTNEVFEMFDFDGWHSDTVGEWGEMQTHDGETLFVKDAYTEFLNNAKAALPDEKHLVFNPVGAEGIGNVNVSDVDVLYTEIWPWDEDENGHTYDSYNSLKKVIERSRDESGGKSLVIPAYMSYDYGEENPGEPFNTAAVMLTSISTYAAGGSRMELGDGNNMLSNEYFPHQNLYMDEELQGRIDQLYDFIVAYENLLRDGQTENENIIDVMGYENTAFGDPNTVWTYGKQDDQYEIVHMINLLGVSSSDWRANEGEKEKPERVEELEVKYYPEREVNSVWLASPDHNDARSMEVNFTKGSDEEGDYIVLDVPSLEYWNMLYMSSEHGEGETSPETTHSLPFFTAAGIVLLLTGGGFWIYRRKRNY